MKFSKDMLKGAAPFVVVQMLDELGEAYGYQLIKAVREESGEVFDFPDSTLYPILYRLEAKKLISSRIQQTANKKDRRYYKVTPDGRKWLADRKSEFKIYIKGLQHFLPSKAV
ncbi:MAG: PadR family transcriptional regulator [Candidatus Gracilibacteria bacterium]|jgi:PadR family transcriptional regulator PadR